MAKQSREKIRVKCPQEWYDHWTEISRAKRRAEGKVVRADKQHTEDEIYEQYHPCEGRELSGRYSLGTWERRATNPDYMGELEKELGKIFAKRKKRR